MIKQNWSNKSLYTYQDQRKGKGELYPNTVIWGVVAGNVSNPSLLHTLQHIEGEIKGLHGKINDLERDALPPKKWWKRACRKMGAYLISLSEEKT